MQALASPPTQLLALTWQQQQEQQQQQQQLASTQQLWQVQGLVLPPPCQQLVRGAPALLQQQGLRQELGQTCS